MQGGAEAVGQLRRAESAGHITIGFKVGSEVAAGGVPGRVGVALNDPVSLLSAHASAHQSEQNPLAEHHTAGGDFRANLEADDDVTSRLSAAELADCFSTALHQENLGVIWERLGI